MSGRKKRRPAAPRTEPVPAKAAAPEEPPPRRQGLFGSALTSTGPSALPPIGRSLGRGMLAVAVQPVLIVAACLIVLGTWVALVALGFEGSPSRLVDLLAMPPVSTYFDLGTGATLYGIGPAFLVYLGVSLAVRTLVSSLLAGLVLEALEDGRVSRYGAIRGLIAMPTVLVVQVASLSLIVAGNLIFPILGPGIGFLGFVSALVAGLYFLGFAPTAAIREGRPVLDTIRRSARAAMLPGGRHLVLCSLYFFIALPVALGFAPGGTEVTANPTLLTWVFVLSANVLHLGFAAAFAYRWVVAEPNVPDEPVRRRPATRPAPSRPRRR
ncbi:MAG TPA: hypothetical protein VID69_09510 [Actinomycetota bacterium]|jgi:hypothetical protein